MSDFSLEFSAGPQAHVEPFSEVALFSRYTQFNKSFSVHSSAGNGQRHHRNRGAHAPAFERSKGHGNTKSESDT